MTQVCLLHDTKCAFNSLPAFSDRTYSILSLYGVGLRCATISLPEHTRTHTHTHTHAHTHTHTHRCASISLPGFSAITALVLLLSRASRPVSPGPSFVASLPALKSQIDLLQDIASSSSGGGPGGGFDPLSKSGHFLRVSVENKLGGSAGGAYIIVYHYLYSYICIYVCICIYVYMYTHTHTHTHAHTHTHTHIYMYTYTYIYTYVGSAGAARVNIGNMSIHIHTCIHV
jgi:hypothetical protein